MKVKSWDKSVYLLKGLLLSYIITFVLILMFSMLLTFSNLREGKTSLLNTLVMIISITSGGIYVAGKVKEKGWINGGVLGISYYFILILLNILLLRPIIIDMFSISKLIIAFTTGIIGGIIGINIS